MLLNGHPKEQPAREPEEQLAVWMGPGLAGSRPWPLPKTRPTEATLLFGHHQLCLYNGDETGPPGSGLL